MIPPVMQIARNGFSLRVRDAGLSLNLNQDSVTRRNMDIKLVVCSKFQQGTTEKMPWLLLLLTKSTVGKQARFPSAEQVQVNMACKTSLRLVEGLSRQRAVQRLKKLQTIHPVIQKNFLISLHVFCFQFSLPLLCSFKQNRLSSAFLFSNFSVVDPLFSPQQKTAHGLLPLCTGSGCRSKGELHQNKNF